MAESANQRYINKYAELAMEQMRLYGIPASITLAQGIIESSNGTGYIALNANNHFGIKGEYNGQFILRSDDKNDEKFRKYENVGQSFEDHSRVLLKERYQSRVGQLGKDDYKGWAEGIAAGGYATQKGYADRLVEIIELNGLQKYDQMVIEQMRKEGKTMVTKADLASGSSPSLKPTGMDLPEGRYSMPVNGKEFLLVTSPYGNRRDPMNRSVMRPHYGIDIQTRSDAVLATEDNGKVVSVNHNTNTDGGKHVIVQYDRPDGTKNLVSYLHLSVIDVKVGDTVNAGDKLGISGNTGRRTTGEHLHFGVSKVDADGKREWIDPAAYLAEIRQKGNLQTEALHNGRDLMAQYKPGGEAPDKEQLAQKEGDKREEKSEDRKEDVTPESWGEKLLKSPLALGMGLTGGSGGGIIESLLGLLMSLLFLDFGHGNRTKEEQLQAVTDTAVSKRVDLSRYTPHFKSSELSVRDNGTMVLTTNDGRNDYSHTLTDAEQSRFRYILESDADKETKGQRIGALVTAITFSQQASRNYDQILEQQLGQDQTMQRR